MLLLGPSLLSPIPFCSCVPSAGRSRFWPFVQTVNLWLVPLRFRVLFQNGSAVQLNVERHSFLNGF